MARSSTLSKPALPACALSEQRNGVLRHCGVFHRVAVVVEPFARRESGVDDAEQLRWVIGLEGALAIQPVPQARQGLCRGEDQFTELLVAQRAQPLANRPGVLGLLHGSGLAWALVDTRLRSE